MSHEASSHEASSHEASSHEALSHEALVFATSSQLALSNTEPPPLTGATNVSSPLFGFGGFVTLAALLAVISPTPPAPTATDRGRAESIRAPLTWSGDQFGCRAMICAAVPDTTGAANDVPESCM